MARATKVLKCQNKVFFGSFSKTGIRTGRRRRRIFRGKARKPIRRPVRSAPFFIRSVSTNRQGGESVGGGCRIIAGGDVSRSADRSDPPPFSGLFKTIFLRSFWKNLIFALPNLSSMRHPPSPPDLITLFVGEDGAGKAKRAFRIRQAGENREPSQESSDCPEKERNSPFAAEDAPKTRNDGLLAAKRNKYAVALVVSLYCERRRYLYFGSRI